MKINSSAENKAIRHQFDCFCKKVLKNEARNCYTEKKFRSKNEVIFSELLNHEIGQLNSVDEYFTDYYVFKVFENDVAVRNENIGEALSILSEHRRDIILLSYFLDMSDKEIGEKLNLERSTVQYQRSSALKQFKLIMEEKEDE